MRKTTFSMLTLALAVLTPLGARAADTPAARGIEAKDNVHYVKEQVNDQLDYIGDDMPCPWFYGQAEVMLLRRELTNINFPATSQGVAGPVLAQLQDLNFKTEAGVKITLGHRFNDWWSVEGVYFGQHEWFDQFVVTDPNSRLFGVLNRFGTAQQPIFPVPPFPPTFGIGNNTFFQSGDYKSRDNNVELNAVRDLIEIPLGDEKDGPTLSVAGLVGLRYFRLKEFFSLRTRGSRTPGLPDDPNARADYVVDVDDDALGGQFGARVSLKMMDRLTLGCEGKFAVLGLSGEQRSVATFAFFQPTFIPGRLAASDGTIVTSYIGQITATASFKVTEKIFLRGGYDVFWLTNRALAPDQVDANATQNNRITPMINVKGTTMFYGSSFGLEFKF